MIQKRYPKLFEADEKETENTTESFIEMISAPDFVEKLGAKILSSLNQSQNSEVFENKFTEWLTSLAKKAKEGLFNVVNSVRKGVSNLGQLKTFLSKLAELSGLKKIGKLVASIIAMIGKIPNLTKHFGTIMGVANQVGDSIKSKLAGKMKISESRLYEDETGLKEKLPLLAVLSIAIALVALLGDYTGVGAFATQIGHSAATVGQVLAGIASATGLFFGVLTGAFRSEANATMQKESFSYKRHVPTMSQYLKEEYGYDFDTEIADIEDEYEDEDEYTNVVGRRSNADSTLLGGLKNPKARKPFIKPKFEDDDESEIEDTYYKGDDDDMDDMDDMERNIQRRFRK